MTIKGIDCATPITATAAQALYQLGYRFACRYLVPASYPKHLGTDEARILTDAGFKILSIFETTANRAGGGGKNGAEDGATALQVAKNINMPSTGTIFFAVDYDAAPKEMDTIEAYLRAAVAQAAPYKIGVYGSYSVIETMAARGACDGFWQALAWSGGNTPLHATIHQYTATQTVAGLSVDLDEATSDVGMWNYNDTGSDLNMTIDEAKTALTTLDGTGTTHSAWSDQAVVKLMSAGVFNGDGNGNYGWEQCVTREAVAQVLYNMLTKLGLIDKL